MEPVRVLIQVGVTNSRMRNPMAEVGKVFEGTVFGLELSGPKRRHNVVESVTFVTVVAKGKQFKITAKILVNMWW